jgi:hypothetical protein
LRNVVCGDLGLRIHDRHHRLALAAAILHHRSEGTLGRMRASRS